MPRKPSPHSFGRKTSERSTRCRPVLFRWWLQSEWGTLGNISGKEAAKALGRDGWIAVGQVEAIS